MKKDDEKFVLINVILNLIKLKTKEAKIWTC